tara:strand:+ start:163 stop:375 length:213 start_codon:yes stop_codon:yes gene_type:complete
MGKNSLPCMPKKPKKKYKNVTAISFTTSYPELIISFSGFERENDCLEFLDLVFQGLDMQHHKITEPVTLH